jgi:hypothetical protein
MKKENSDFSKIFQEYSKNISQKIVTKVIIKQIGVNMFTPTWN